MTGTSVMTPKISGHDCIDIDAARKLWKQMHSSKRDVDSSVKFQTRGYQGSKPERQRKRADGTDRGQRHLTVFSVVALDVVKMKRG